MFVKLFVCFRVLVLVERKALFGFVHFIRAYESVLMFLGGFFFLFDFVVVMVVFSL